MSVLPPFNRPNILILYTDQQRADTLGCYGQQAIDTPNIDALAASGMRFDRFFVQNPVCAPSRASFLTGRYCSALHIGTNGIAFSKEEYPISRLLKPYGYETAQIGKLHFDPHARRDHRDPTDTYWFDTFILSDEPGCYDDAYTKWVEATCPEQLDKVRTMLPPAALLWGKKGYSEVPRNTHEPYVFEGDAGLTHTAFVTDQTCRFLRDRDPRKPFFAIAGYYAPHPPLNPPQEYLDRVDRTKLRQ
ncbi:MAG: sulfatase-like hydrolase/transferase, partial [Clostridia bacterium]|nr:sulfatase-like hydrolase/transferase [Clostridia bacterium]